MKRYYIAYGSNLNVQQMRWRCPGARIIGTAELQDYRLLFKGSKTGSYLTVEPEKGCTVPVAVWEVTEQDELALDRYEGDACSSAAVTSAASAFMGRSSVSDTKP